MWGRNSFPRRPDESSGDHRRRQKSRADESADFWSESVSWEPKSHEIDPDAPTRPGGLDRVLHSQTAEELRTRWSLPRIDPFASRLLLILAAFALVAPVAWSTRRTTESVLALSRNQASTVTSQSFDLTNSDLNEPGRITAIELPAVVSPSMSDNSTLEISTASPAEGVNAEVATMENGETRAIAQRTETTSAPSTQTCGSTYVVRAGDSWLLIADRASIPAKTLLERNGATARDVLYPGDELCLPPGVRVVIPATTVSPSATLAPSVAVAPTTTAAIPPSPSTAEVQSIIRAVWPDDLEERALDIVWRESRYQADVDNGICCVGLFQIYWTIHRVWLGSEGVTSREQLFDAETNTRAALALYERSLAQRGDGWQPWCFGKYLETAACAGL